MRFDIKTKASPEQVLRALTEFTDARLQAAPTLVSRRMAVPPGPQLWALSRLVVEQISEATCTRRCVGSVLIGDRPAVHPAAVGDGGALEPCSSVAVISSMIAARSALEGSPQPDW